jgi:hypothetical protein
MKRLTTNEESKKFYEGNGKSLFIFSYDNCLRNAIISIFKNEKYN